MTAMKEDVKPALALKTVAVHFHSQYLTNRPARPFLAPVRNQYRSSTPRRDPHPCTAAPPTVKSMCEKITFDEAEWTTPPQQMYHSTDTS